MNTHCLNSNSENPRVLNRTAGESLRFTPYVWAKLLFLQDVSNTAMGGFGICDHGDLFLVRDFALIEQVSTCLTVKFSDKKLNNFYETRLEANSMSDQLSLIWIQTNPDSFPSSSLWEKQELGHLFKQRDWFVTAEFGTEGQAKASMHFRIGSRSANPRVETQLDVEVDYQAMFPKSNHQMWLDEYKANVRCLDPFASESLCELTLNDDLNWQSSEWVAS